MFIIGGVQGKNVRLDHQAIQCPVCNTSNVYNQRIDQYITLFFIPLFRIKKGIAYLKCEGCESIIGDEILDKSSRRTGTGIPQCRWCGKGLDKTFSFCPYCGKQI